VLPLQLQQLVKVQYLMYTPKMSVFRQLNPTWYVKIKSQQLLGIKTYSTYAAGMSIVQWVKANGCI